MNKDESTLSHASEPSSSELKQGHERNPLVTTIFYRSAAAAPSIESFPPTHSWQLRGHNITQLAPEPGRCCW
jgi:hypothetical protein